MRDKNDIQRMFKCKHKHKSRGQLKEHSSHAIELLILRYSALLDFHRVLHEGKSIWDNKVVTNINRFSNYCVEFFGD